MNLKQIIPSIFIGAMLVTVVLLANACEATKVNEVPEVTRVGAADFGDEEKGGQAQMETRHLRCQTQLQAQRGETSQVRESRRRPWL